MGCEIRLESGERKVVGSRVVCASPDAERADRSVEDAMGTAATGGAIAAATGGERENEHCANSEQDRDAAHGAVAYPHAESAASSLAADAKRGGKCRPAYPSSRQRTTCRPPSGSLCAKSRSPA
jgi:hypothetical protein